MKKILILITSLLTTVSLTYAAGLVKDTKGAVANTAIQGPAPDGTLTKRINADTPSSRTTDMRSRTAYFFYAPNACKLRLTPTSTQSLTYMQVTMPAGVRERRIVNSATPFSNYSCPIGTTGELELQ